jgi:hypothetical protein
MLGYYLNHWCESPFAIELQACAWHKARQCHVVGQGATHANVGLLLKSLVQESFGN